MPSTPSAGSPSVVVAQAPSTSTSTTAGRDGAAGSAEPPAPAQTSDERRATLDRRLDESLGEFDARIRKEREAVAQERDAHQSGSAEGEDGAADESSDREYGSPSDDPILASTGNTGDEGGNSRPGDLKSDKRRPGTNTATGEGSGAAATEIPDGSDDDIVARRLRKAAEQETDPELKEKLWKEYIEYKKNGQGKSS